MPGWYKDFVLMITENQRFLLQRREWASGSAFVRRIEFSAAPKLRLPFEVRVTEEARRSRPPPTDQRATQMGPFVRPGGVSGGVRSGLPQISGGVLPPAQLSGPQLLELLLEASREALNARPLTRPAVQATRLERWFGHQPYVGTLLHAPGDLVSAPASKGRVRTLGIYSCPTGDARHVLFDLELGERRIVSDVYERATPFILDTVRGSRVRDSFFAGTPDLAWDRGSLGFPRWFSDGLGLAMPVWLNLRPRPSSFEDKAGEALAAPLSLTVNGSSHSPAPVVSEAVVSLARAAFGSLG